MLTSTEIWGNTTLYAHWTVCTNHTYNAEVCTTCGAKLPYDNQYDTSAAGVYQVTANTAYIRTGPYQVKDLVKTLSKDETVQITGSVINSYGNVWLKTSDGYYTHAEKLQRYIQEVKDPDKDIEEIRGGSPRPPKQYTVTLDDGSTCSLITVTNGEAYGALRTPAKSGYTFDG